MPEVALFDVLTLSTYFHKRGDSRTVMLECTKCSNCKTCPRTLQGSGNGVTLDLPGFTPSRGETDSLAPSAGLRRDRQGLKKCPN